MKQHEGKKLKNSLNDFYRHSITEFTDFIKKRVQLEII